MTTQSITSGQVKQFKRFVEDAGNRALEDINPDKANLQRLIENGGDFQAHIRAGIKRYTTAVPDYALAGTVLGKDFISPEVISKARGVTYDTEQLATLNSTFPSQDAIEWCRDNDMILVAGPPRAMSLMDIRTLKSKYFSVQDAGWYSKTSQKFARNDKVTTNWIALGKEPVIGSLGQNWDEQRKLVANPMIVPNAAEMVWALTTYEAVHGSCLYQNVYVRTSSFDVEGDCVGVGSFDSANLYVSSYRNEGRFPGLGIAAARRF
jgi:hypothetical protein